jgi:hypothetical protein
MLQSATVTVHVVFEDDQVVLATIAQEIEGAAHDAGAHDATAQEGESASAGCVTCGADMTLTAVEVSHHLDGDGAIDYDLDADHVALAPTGCWAAAAAAMPAESAGQ